MAIEPEHERTTVNTGPRTFFPLVELGNDLGQSRVLRMQLGVEVEEYHVLGRGQALLVVGRF